MRTLWEGFICLPALLAKIGWKTLIDTTDFPMRWDSGNWTPQHGWTHIVADLAIAVAYAVISIALAGYWWKKRGELAFPKLLWIFGAFIFSCGSMHAVEAVLFYYPVYRLSALLKVITAVVSWAAVIAMLRAAPRAVRLSGLQRANGELEEQLEKTREATCALARSNRDLEAFTGLIAHDLRNPLSSAMFTVSLAREAAASGDVRMGLAQLDRALESLHQMGALIRELHDDALLRTEPDEMKIHQLDEIIAAARSNLAPLVAERGVTFEVTGLSEVKGSRTMLIQLFINLFENAIKYSVESAPSVRVEGERDAQGGLVVRVLDGGLGIPSSQLERVFESGFRSEQAEHLPGSGLGLAFCRKIMEAHGGSLRALPTEGGAMLEARFPPVS